MIVIRLFYSRDTVRINGNGQSDSSMNCCLHLRPESNSKTCKGDSNYRIQSDMVAALMTAGAKLCPFPQQKLGIDSKTMTRLMLIIDHIKLRKNFVLERRNR